MLFIIWLNYGITLCVILCQVLEICQEQSCGNRQKLAVAKFDFEAEYPAELSFQKVRETGVLNKIYLSLNMLYFILSTCLILNNIFVLCIWIYTHSKTLECGYLKVLKWCMLEWKRFLCISWNRFPAEDFYSKAFIFLCSHYTTAYFQRRSLHQFTHFPPFSFLPSLMLYLIPDPELNSCPRHHLYTICPLYYLHLQKFWPGIELTQ